MKEESIKKTGTILLAAGWILFSAVIVDDVRPFLSSFLVFHFFRDWIPVECLEKIPGIWEQHLNAEQIERYRDQLISLCFSDRLCRWMVAWRFDGYLMKVVFALAALSVIFSPRKTRTRRGYHARVALLIFSAMLGGVFGIDQVFYAVLWAPLVMLLREFWYPLPGDQPVSFKRYFRR